MTGASALYVGKVMHRRLRPRRHQLRYRVFSLLLDLDEIDALAAGSRLFSRGRFNLFAFHDRDHGDGSTTPLRRQVEGHLAAAGIMPDGGAIRLLTMPRILGFAFNPLSIFFCYGRAGGLRAILYEVNNTFGQRHSYLLPVPGEHGATIRQCCAKAFHVSPFIAMDMDYAFTLTLPAERLALGITVSDGLGPLLVATHAATRRAFSDGALLRVFVTHPLLTLKVVGGILWEAARLWLKGVPVHTCPPPPDRPISIPSQTGKSACI